TTDSQSPSPSPPTKRRRSPAATTKVKLHLHLHLSDESLLILTLTDSPDEAQQRRRSPAATTKRQGYHIFDLYTTELEQHPVFLNGCGARRPGNVPQVMLLDPNLSQTKGRKRDGKGTIKETVLTIQMRKRKTLIHVLMLRMMKRTYRVELFFYMLFWQWHWELQNGCCRIHVVGDGTLQNGCCYKEH
ncbi:hypothetical protein Dimus_031792, partial [Dionaea muscipula]